MALMSPPIDGANFRITLFLATCVCLQKRVLWCCRYDSEVVHPSPSNVASAQPVGFSRVLMQTSSNLHGILGAVTAVSYGGPWVC